MTTYFLGVDIGNTKSHALIVDEHGRVVGAGVAGNGNHEVVGDDGFERVLHSITADALAEAQLPISAIKGAGYGIAGCDWDSDLPLMQRVIDATGLTAPYEVVNDCVIGLVAGAQKGWGVVVVAGTGCNARGRSADGRSGRVTGEGTSMGEHGGGGELVRQALAAVSRAWSLRAPQTLLSPMLVHATGATNVFDLLEGVVRGRYHLHATYAPLVFAAAEQGDGVAQHLIINMGRDLADLGIGVIRQLQFENETFDLVQIGSLFNGGNLIETAFKNDILAFAPHANFVRLAAPPVVGGVLLGMAAAGVDFTGVRDTVIESVETWFAAHSEGATGNA